MASKWAWHLLLTAVANQNWHSICCRKLKPIKIGVAFVVDSRHNNMAASMRKAVLRQTSFPSLRRRCLCLSSRSFASGKDLYLAQHVYVADVSLLK